MTYETEKLDVAGGETQKEPFKDVNPKGKVPTLLRDDGSVDRIRCHCELDREDGSGKASAAV